MKKPFRQTQTLRAASNKTEPTIFTPTQTPVAPRRTGKMLSAAAVYIQTHFYEDQFNQFSVILQTVPPTDTDSLRPRR